MKNPERTITSMVDTLVKKLYKGRTKDQVNKLIDVALSRLFEKLASEQSNVILFSELVTATVSRVVADKIHYEVKNHNLTLKDISDTRCNMLVRHDAMFGIPINWNQTTDGNIVTVTAKSPSGRYTTTAKVGSIATIKMVRLLNKVMDSTEAISDADNNESRRYIGYTANDICDASTHNKIRHTSNMHIALVGYNMAPLATYYNEATNRYEIEIDTVFGLIITTHPIQAVAKVVALTKLNAAMRPYIEQVKCNLDYVDSLSLRKLLIRMGKKECNNDLDVKNRHKLASLNKDLLVAYNDMFKYNKIVTILPNTTKVTIKVTNGDNKTIGYKCTLKLQGLIELTTKHSDYVIANIIVITKALNILNAYIMHGIQGKWHEHQTKILKERHEYSSPFDVEYTIYDKVDGEDYIQTPAYIATCRIICKYVYADYDDPITAILGLLSNLCLEYKQ